ncbi:type III restriction enzyme, res subunit family protein [Ditylenchus destructor]|uniref:Type III restriction enzyme, res subunit family protein n=1 Tax=Ditylenchus destructor TaxID=166010 RepID=A0AAD4N4D7_9BILA|nr:type III restriction enzyme, res subunit family protein [Ditylenchus destructor]
MSRKQPLKLENVKDQLQNIGIETILKWHTKKHGGILADEMGLGKTCQAVIAVAILSSEGHAPALVICPLSVIDHWENEILRFSCGALKPYRYYASKAHRETVRDELKKREWNVLLTTFETYLNDYELLDYRWGCAVFDEAHRIKNEQSQMHQAIEKSQIDFLLMMTGTPVQNNLTELYSLLQLADTEKFPFNELEDFLGKYRNIRDPEVSSDFHTMFKEYCLRRTKEILHEVPPASEVVLYHGLTSFQTAMYKAILRNNRQFFTEISSNPLHNRQSLMNVLVQLRKTVCHPYLFKGVEKEPFVEGEHLVNQSGKMLILDRLLKYLHAKRHTVLIFTQMRLYLDILCDYMNLRGYNVEQIDGSTKSGDRLSAIENFQRKDSDVFCFLLTTKAGGVGLNLTAADTVIFLDWDFNPQNDKQAAARCHRIGQTKPVKIIRLIAKHTVEEIIKYRANRKLRLSEYALGEENGLHHVQSELFANLLIEELKELETEEAATVKASKAITDEELEAIIGRTGNDGTWEIEEDKENIKNKSHLQEEEEEEKSELLETKAMYKFEGEDYSENRKHLEEFIMTKSDNIDFDDVNPDINEKEIDEIASDLMQKTTIKAPRKALTAEEKEIREKQRREREIKRRQQQELEKLQKKQKLWKDNDYHSANLELESSDIQQAAEQGSIYNVFGDVTKPVRSVDDNDGKAIILHAVDDGGHFGYGGVFTALRNLDNKIIDKYELAGRMKDLNCGDCHLINDVMVQTSSAVYLENRTAYDAPGRTAVIRNVSIGLMIVQSARDRYRRIISKSALEKCFKRVANYAVKESSKSVHLPMFWFGVQNIDERSVRSMIVNCLCKYGIHAYIYKFRRGANRITQQHVVTKPKAAPKPSSTKPTTSRQQPAKRRRVEVKYAQDGEEESSEEDTAQSDEEFEPEEDAASSSEEEMSDDDMLDEEMSVSEHEESDPEDDESPDKKRSGRRHW